MVNTPVPNPDGVPEGHHRLLLGGVQHRGQLETDALARGLGLRGRRKLAHAFRRVYSYKRLQLAHLRGQPGVFLTWSQDIGIS